MSSCCGNEVLFNSVISEVVDANLGVIADLADACYSAWSTVGAVIVFGAITLVLIHKISYKLRA